MTTPYSTDSHSLAALLAPISVQKFVHEHLGRDVLHLRGDPDRLSGLFGWDAINDLLTAHRFDSSRVRIVRNSEMVPFPLFTEVIPRLNTESKARRVVPEVVARYLSENFTLVLYGVDESHEPMRTWTTALEQIVQVPVQVNAYISVGHEMGFRVHWDDHEVIVLQVSGSKRWALYGQTLAAPVTHVADPPRPSHDAEPIQVLTMHAGDFLHVPRGTWHGVTSLGGPTVHLTVGFRRPSVADLLYRAVGELTSKHEALRVNAPIGGSVDLSDWVKEVVALSTKLLADPALFARVLSRDSVPPRTSSELPQHLSPDID